jgi:hypothetical protein
MIASGVGQSNMWYASAWYMLKDEEQKVEQRRFSVDQFRAGMVALSQVVTVAI